MQIAVCDGSYHIVTVSGYELYLYTGAKLTDPFVEYWAVPVCQGELRIQTYSDIDAVFREFLAPDPQVIGLVMGSALVFWLTGHWLGRVMRVFRKIS